MIEYSYICSDAYLINTQSDSDDKILETIIFFIFFLYLFLLFLFYYKYF